MSQLKVNSVVDASGGSNAVLYGVASPPSSMGFRNRLINSNMAIDQRNAGASLSYPASTYANCLDRWQAQNATDGAFTIQQVAEAPAGFVNSLKFTTTTADASLAATQQAWIRQPIEGLNTADLAWGSSSAQPVTLSFWVRSSLTGTFGGALTNNAENRSYPFTYTINAAATWEYKTVTIPGDTTGTWLTTNSRGIVLMLGLGVGSTYSGTAGAWAGSSFFTATGAVSVIGTLNATWQITGVQLEAGSVASPFERRDYGRELMMCQRYYYRQTSQAAGDYFVPNAYAISTTQAFGYNTFPVPMRTRPTALEQSGTAADYNVVRCGLGTNANCSSVPTFGVANLTSAQTVFTVSSGLSNGTAGSVQANNTNAYLGWSAEL
jgi:hypothetical protein